MISATGFMDRDYLRTEIKARFFEQTLRDVLASELYYIHVDDVDLRNNESYDRELAELEVRQLSIDNVIDEIIDRDLLDQVEQLDELEMRH